MDSSDIDPDGHNWINNTFERIRNSFKYGEFVTDAGLAEAFERERLWLINNVATGSDQVRVLQQAPVEDINRVYRSWSVAIEAAQGGAEVITPITSWRRAEDGSGALVVYRGGNSLVPRIGIDVKIDKQTGLLREGGGVSVHVDPNNHFI